MYLHHALSAEKLSFLCYADFSPVFKFMKGLKLGSTETQCYMNTSK